MDEKNRHSDGASRIDRRTYLRGGALALGILASPVVTSKEAKACSRELPNSISVVSDDDRRAFYRFTTSDTIKARWQADLSEADYPDGVEGQTAFGSVAEGGADNFCFAGEITDFALSGPATIYINGDEIDAEERWGSTLPNSLVVVSDGERLASYRFGVSGTIDPGAVADLTNAAYSEVVDDGDAIGWVAEGGADNFFFSGVVTEFAYNGPLTVYRNGQQVDPDTFFLNNRLVIVGQNQYARYDVTTSGRLAGRRLTQEDEIVSSTEMESRASGAVKGGRDEYLFSGSITGFGADGPVRVFVGPADGTLDERPADSFPLPNSLDIIGRDQRADYSFRVTGQLQGTSLTHEDSIAGSSATGAVRTGTDSYQFAGDIDDFAVSGPVTVRLNGETIVPVTL